MNIALISMYEGGLQPLGLSTAAAHLLAAGHNATCIDGSIDAVGPIDAEIIAFSVPLFQGIDATVDQAEGLRENGFNGPLLFYGAYSWLNRERLLSSVADGVILGDWEQTLVNAANKWATEHTIQHIDGLQLRDASNAAPFFSRKLPREIPARQLLPKLSAYRYPEAERRLEELCLVGNVETARGCPYPCSYCSVYATYNRRVSIIESRAVLGDIDQLAKMGATHICFVDAEFLSAPRNALEIVEQMHQRYPYLTFDFTSRCDLLAEDPLRVRKLVSCGARFVTSAFEFPDDKVLEQINKGFRVSAILEAISVCRSEGLSLNPTFLLFNPWIEFDDLVRFAEFLDDNCLADDIETIQLQTRLWLYKGSPLLDRDDIRGLVTVEHRFNFDWRHNDEAIEDVFQRLVATTDSSGIKRCCLKC